MQSIIKIKSIKIKERRRGVNQKKVDELAESIREIGLINPITINDKKMLLAGYHRLEACKKLGFIDIDCNVLTDCENMDAELVEIDENLIRNDLLPFDRGQYEYRRKQIYEIKYPETKQGGDRKSEDAKSKNNDYFLKDTFVKDTANKTGLSKDTIQKDIFIQEKIIPEIKEKIPDLPIAGQTTELLALAKLEPEQQKEAFEKYKSGEIKKISDYSSIEISDEEWQQECYEIFQRELQKLIEKYLDNNLISNYCLEHNLIK
jgi:ParB family chromosome partitioning protein